MFTGSREIPKPSAQKTFANRFLVRVPFRFHGGPKLLTGRTQKLLHAGKGILGMGCPLIIQPYIYTLYSGYVLGICISPFTGLLWGGLKKQLGVPPSQGYHHFAYEECNSGLPLGYGCCWRSIITSKNQTMYRIGSMEMEKTPTKKHLHFCGIFLSSFTKHFSST